MPKVTKEELPDDFRNMEVKSNPDLNTMEQETCLSFSKDLEKVHVYSDISTFIKWILSVEDAEVLWAHIEDEAIVGCKASIPKGILKMKSKPRNSNRHYGMVGYGDARD